MSAKSNQENYSFTDGVLEFYTISTIGFIFCGVVYLIFAETDISIFLTTGAILLSWILFIGFLLGSFRVVSYVNNKFNVGKMESLRNNMLIGLGGMAIFSTIPRITVYFFNDLNTLYYTIFVSVPAALSFYYKFSLDFSNDYEIDYNDRGWDSFFWKLMGFHFVSTIIALRIGTALYQMPDIRILPIFGFHFVFFFTCVSSTRDFCQVWRGGFKKKGTGNVVEQKHVTECLTLKKSAFRVECKICAQEYSETRIPRILKECGHTVCEWCANDLLNKNNRRFLFCPFCQEVIVVKGSVNLLRKNYEALEIIDNMKMKMKKYR